MSVTDTVERFDFGTRLGYSYIVQASFLSLFSVLRVLVFMTYNVLKRRRATGRWPPLSHMNVYLPNLFFWDLILSTGRIFDLRWMILARVVEGPICTAEGILRQIGDAGVAMTIMAIAIHTFLLLVNFDSRPAIAVYVCSAILLFNILAVGIGLATHLKTPFYGNTGNWCWILKSYPVQRIVLEYGWMWTAAFVNVVVYVSIAIVIMRSPSGVYNHNKASARKMLGYPLVYLIVVTPISIARWLTFSGTHVPFSVLALASVLLTLSGFFNVQIYHWKKPGSEARHSAVREAISNMMIEHNGLREETKAPGIRDRAGIQMDELDEEWNNPSSRKRSESSFA